MTSTGSKYGTTEDKKKEEENMKTKLTALTILLLSTAMFISCAGSSQATVQEVINVGPLAKIVVFQGKLLPGEAGKARGEPILPTINIGGSIVLTAMGRDANDNDIAIEPTWMATNPAIVEITPKKGPTVTIKGLKKGSTDLIIEFSGIIRKFETIYVE